MAKKGIYTDAAEQALNELNSGTMTSNTPNPPTPAGGITVDSTLLPNVKEGDVITLRVQKVDLDKGEVHLVLENKPEAVPEVAPTAVPAVA